MCLYPWLLCFRLEIFTLFPTLALAGKTQIGDNSVMKMHLPVDKCSHKLSPTCCPPVVIVLHCGSSPKRRCLNFFFFFYLITAEKTAGTSICLNYLHYTSVTQIYHTVQDYWHMGSLWRLQLHSLALLGWSGVSFSPFVRKFQSSKTAEEYPGCFAQLCSLPWPQWKSTLPLGNVCWWTSFRLLHKLQGDDALPSKTALQNTRMIYRFILTFWIELCIFQFLHLNSTLQKHCLCICVCRFL